MSWQVASKRRILVVEELNKGKAVKLCRGYVQALYYDIGYFKII
jgi:hypothetical protein